MRPPSVSREAVQSVPRVAVRGAAHGSASGSYTDLLGPDASREMLRFFEASWRGQILR